MGKRAAKRLKRRFYGKIGSVPIRMLLFVLSVLPLKYLSIVGKDTALLVFFLLRRRRKITMDNLRLALGQEKNEAAIRGIYRSTLGNIGKGCAEILAYPRLHDRYFHDNVSVEGRGRLDEALSLGKGVVAVSAHFGNFSFLAIKLAQMGYPLSAVFRFPRLEGLTQNVIDLANKTGVKLISDKPARLCVQKSLRCLRKNGILFLLADQNVSSGGVYVDFFGQMVPTFKGPVVLAIRTGAPLLPVFIVREDGNRHRIMIAPPLDLKLTGDMDRDVFLNVTRLSKISESYIRKYPDQWWWIHRRWRKARPL